ncbi:hypothetical protein EXIGLDRAFT_691569 [Exidia glandulosa HHB12029]|uniref:F-box domain-containing protein n=1 Tax=Exidia glandulosa HHB12029 TaxID=1314781 RepID=A0A165IJF5_EXIGL|nr:hypothetical protein EXIGLDRAFT_691569 [Exidia glandulosa HHB12029]
MSSVPPPRGVDYTRLVSSDLLLCIFDGLEQPELLAATGTCRRWRSLALPHRDLFYRMALKVDVHDTDFYWALYTFRENLRYVRDNNFRASVDVDWSVSGPSVGPQGGVLQVRQETPDLCWFNPALTQRVLATAHVMSAIQESLPCLVKIHLTFGAILYKTLEQCIFPHLRHPALQLQELHIQISAPPVFYKVASSTLPRNLFAGNAPKLTNVVLVGVLCATQRSPAFAKVSTVGIYSLPEGVRLPGLFPALRDVSLHVLEKPSDLATVSGFSDQLQSLCVGVAPESKSTWASLAVLAKIPKTRIRFGMYGVQPDEVAFEPFLRDLPPRLLVEIKLNEMPRSVTISVTGYCPDDHAASKDVQRSFDLIGCTPSSLRGLLRRNIGALGARMAELHVHEQFFNILPDIFDVAPILKTLGVFWPACDDPDFYFALPSGHMHSPNLHRFKFENETPKLRASATMDPTRLVAVLCMGRYAVWPEHSAQHDAGSVPKNIFSPARRMAEYETAEYTTCEVCKDFPDCTKSNDFVMESDVPALESVV